MTLTKETESLDASPKFSHDDNPSKLIIAGYYATGSGYPNGEVTVQILSGRIGLRTINCGFAMAEDRHLWNLLKARPIKKLVVLFYVAWNNARSLIQVLRHVDARRDIVYVRYPAMPFMLLMGLVPPRYRPRCYVDSFISVWESMFIDRQKGSRHGLFSRLVRWLEVRSLRCAYRILVDTRANKEFFSVSLGIAKNRIWVLPLGVEEKRWRAQPPTERDPGIFTVLFVGTFVPLHGLGVIASAIENFPADRRIRFMFVGDGQDAWVLESLIKRRSDLDIVWHRKWTAPEDLGALVSAADVCLGVFSGNKKSVRVLAYKLYLYLCRGRPVITQAALSAPDDELPPALYVQADSSPEIRQAILSAMDAASLLAELAESGRKYYELYLGNTALENAWRKMLAADHTESGT